ncbi:MAG TPA: hypothetical protein DDZ68_12900 [Parvularcula sp.]|nr:hypothetical protein [Parvularcula sp.]HBS33058.1 hypothetical protein [Parvularcula sp.]
MNNLDGLIETLARMPPKAGRAGIIVRLSLGLLIGTAGAAAFLLVADGLFPTGGHDGRSGASIVKLVYSISLATMAAILLVQFASPELKPGKRHLFAMTPVAVMAMIAMAELFASPPSEWMTLMFGYGVSDCVTSVLVAAPPIFAGLVWSYRKLAPADVQLTGAAIGALAGAVSAALYAIVSGDASICFVFIWFSAAVVATSVIGGLLGNIFLRW